MLATLTNLQRLSERWTGSPEDSSSRASQTTMEFWDERFATDSAMPIRVAAVYASQGRAEELRSTCRKAVQLAWAVPDPARRDRAAKACCFSPLTDRSLQQAALELASSALALSPPGNPYGFHQWFIMTRGIAEYRNGNWETALPDFQTAANMDRFFRIIRITCLYKVMCLVKLGRVTEAQQLMDDAQHWLSTLPPPGEPLNAEGMDHDDIAIWMAYREATALLAEAPMQVSQP